MEDFFRDLEKAELHLHLEGSLEPGTLRELDGSLSPEEIARRYTFDSFEGFIESYKWVLGYLRGPDEYALATRRLLERLAGENVRYAEITLSAGAVLWRGAEFAPIYEAVARAAAESPVEVWWVLDAIRHFGVDHAMRVARLAAERTGDRVVAFGIGGDETRGPAELFAGVFRFAGEHGLRLVPHAGELAGADSVRACLDFGAARIGHGIRAVDDAALLERLRAEDVPLEICLSSNVATGAAERLEGHPLRKIFDAGVPVILNTDDPALFRTTLAREYELAERELGFRRAELEAIARNGFRYAFRWSG